MSYFFSQPHHLHHHHSHPQPHQQQQQQQQHPMPPVSLTSSTRRRAARPPTISAQAKHFRPSRQQPNTASAAAAAAVVRDLAEAPAISAFRARFEAGRSFDLDDDLEFCPNLLTEDDIHSIQSSASDRSSLASISPDSSPLQHQITPATHTITAQQQQSVAAAAAAASAASIQLSPSYHLNQKQSLHAHGNQAVRPRNAIPIVNPSTGMRVSSPPSAMHPNLQRW